MEIQDIVKIHLPYHITRRKQRFHPPMDILRENRFHTANFIGLLFVIPNDEPIFIAIGCIRL